MKLRKFWQVLVFLFLAVGPPASLFGQGLTLGLLDSPQYRMAVAADGRYVELENQYGRIGVQLLVPGLHGSVSPWSWLTVGAGVSYGPVLLSLPATGDLKSEPGYQASGTLMLGPLEIVRPVFSVAAVGWGQFIQAYAHQDAPRQIGATLWTEKREYLYTGYFASTGLALIGQFGRFVFFIGPAASKDYQMLKSRRILSDGEQTFGLERSGWNARSELAWGGFAGFGLRLPARFSITVGVRMNYRDQVAATVSLAQAGSP